MGRQGTGDDVRRLLRGKEGVSAAFPAARPSRQRKYFHPNLVPDQSDRMFKLNGKVALITGAGSGIGAEIARAFVEAGAHVILTDIRWDALQSQARTLSGRGDAFEVHLLDVSDEAACKRVASEVRNRHGHLDILVNNAGIGHVGTLVTTTPADLDRLWAVNVRGVFQLTRAFLAGMLERKSGCILNIASIGGIVGVRDRVAYTTTKFAVVGFTKAVALDHAANGIRSNCICPCRVETPFVSAMIGQYPDPALARAEMEASQPIGRMATPAEVASAALYLASDEASAVTGSALILDGGWSAGR